MLSHIVRCCVNYKNSVYPKITFLNHRVIITYNMVYYEKIKREHRLYWKIKRRVRYALGLTFGVGSLYLLCCYNNPIITAYGKRDSKE